MTIRPAIPADKEAITDLYAAAFENDEGPIVGKLATDLLALKTPPVPLALVWENGTGIAGHIAFSTVMFRSSSSMRVSILAPLAVAPKLHRSGIGSGLVHHGLQDLIKQGVHAALVYGDPEYYGRFGFTVDLGKLFMPPYPLQHEFGWQAMMLAGAKPPERTLEFDCTGPLNNPDLW